MSIHRSQSGRDLLGRERHTKRERFYELTAHPARVTIRERNDRSRVRGRPHGVRSRRRPKCPVTSPTKGSGRRSFAWSVTTFGTRGLATSNRRSVALLRTSRTHLRRRLPVYTCPRRLLGPNGSVRTSNGPKRLNATRRTVIPSRVRYRQRTWSRRCSPEVVSSRSASRRTRR